MLKKKLCKEKLVRKKKVTNMFELTFKFHRYIRYSRWNTCSNKFRKFNFFSTLFFIRTSKIGPYNHIQKFEISSSFNVKQCITWKALFLLLKSFLPRLTKSWFWQWDFALFHSSMEFRQFPHIFLLPKVLNLKSFVNLWRTFIFLVYK